MQRRKRVKRQPPLDERHYVAVELLAQLRRPTREEIADIIGVCRMTLYRWEGRRDFQRELQNAILRTVERIRPRGSSYADIAIVNGDARAAAFVLHNFGMIP